MVPSTIILAVIVFVAALVIDRLIGDPHSVLHPVALIGRFIGWWGKPALYPMRFQRFTGVVFWLITTAIFTLPFFLFASLAPWPIYLVLAPFLLKFCFAWRSLEEHTLAVAGAVREGVDAGRETVRLLVSRDTAHLDREHVLSAGYESMTENLTDSIISPLFYFSIFGLAGAAVYRAANTMDAMLGYRDERVRLGWFSARMDDIFNFIPARVTVLLLLLYFMTRGTFGQALRILKRDGHKRPGFNGGIVMATMAGGCGILFEKPGVYRIGNGEHSLEEAGSDIIRATRIVTVLFAIIACCAVILLGSWVNSTGI